MRAFESTLSLGLRQIGFLLIPASMIGAVLAEPIVRLLYERGEFDAVETTIVAGAFAAFCAGLTFNGTMLLLNRAFFSLQLAWIPTWVALGVLVANAGLDAAFFRLGVWGIPLATSVVNVLGTAALLVLMRGRIGRLDGARIAASYGRIVVASALAAGAAFGVWLGIDGVLGRAVGVQIISVGAGLVVGGLAYFIVVGLLRIREREALLSLLRRHPLGD